MDDSGSRPVGIPHPLICPGCKSTVIIEDDDTTFCESCGHLFDQHSIVEEARPFGSGQQFCHPTSGGYAVKTDATIKEIKEAKLKKDLANYATALGLQGCEVRAFGVFQEAIQRGKFNTVNRGKLLLYASLYYAAIENKRSVTFRKFSDIDSAVNIYDVGRLYKKIVSVLRPTPQQLDSDQLILKMLALLNENLRGVADVFSRLTGSFDFYAIAQLAPKIVSASREAWISEGRPLAPVVAAANVIAFQSIHRMSLSGGQASALLRIQGVGAAGLKRYLEIKALVLQAFSRKASGESLAQHKLFYLYVSVLLDSPDPDLVPTNACILRTEASREKQLASTQEAVLHLKSALDGEAGGPSGLGPETLVRERALLLGVPYSTVSSMCARDLEVIVDQITKPDPSPDDLADELCDD